MAEVSLHGRALRFDSEAHGLLFGHKIAKGLHRVTTITSAQLLALNGTPQIVVPAPGAGLALFLNRVIVSKPAGTAYSGIATGEDMVVKYTNASGAQVSSVIETTGFLDQTTAQTRVAHAPASVSTTAGDYTPVANAALVLHLLTGEITTGTGGLVVLVDYDILPVPITALALK